MIANSNKMDTHFSASAQHTLQQWVDRLPDLATPVWLRGGNLQTLYAKALQEPPPAYRRELLPDSSGEELVAYDFWDAADQDAPLLVLFHGLEGGSDSHYAVELMRAAARQGWHGVVAHFRSCGGVPSKRMYHSGDTPEVAHMLGLLSARYAEIYAVGVSLGGNVLLKYLGEQGRQGRAVPLHGAAAVSAPVDLPAAGESLSRGWPRLLYTRYFLDSLLPKVPPQPGLVLRSLADFDEAYTAPLNGFAGKDDYYRQASSKPYLPDIALPTLLLNARNDPFLPGRFLPGRHEVSPLVYLLQPSQGGHVGFVSGSGRGHLRWMPQTVLSFSQAVRSAAAGK